MSVDSKRARAERRAQTGPEQTARAVLLWVVPGEGWYWAVADMPESVARQYAVSISGPEILPIAMAKSFELLEEHAGKGVIT